jgi:thymidylate synthase
MNPMFVVKAKTIQDAWFQLVYNLMLTDSEGNFINAYPTGIIQQGSFMNNSSRLQFPGAAIAIEYPLIDRIVTMPEGSGLPPPTDVDKVEAYFYRYIIGTELAENETYTYGQRINVSLQATMDMLKNTPITNQATIEVGQPDDTFNCIGKDGHLDPPCLRLIDFKVIPKFKDCCCVLGASDISDTIYLQENCKCNGTKVEIDRGKSRLDMTVYFRSWDLYAGFPENLAGLSKLQEMISEYIGIPVGYMYAYSAGLHLYKYQKELAEMRTRLTVPEY